MQAHIIMLTSFERSYIEADEEHEEGLIDGLLLKPVKNQVLIKEIMRVLSTNRKLTETAKSPIHRAPAARIKSQKSVLIVDDNEVNRRLCTYILSKACLLYTSPSPRDLSTSRMPSSA